MQRESYDSLFKYYCIKTKAMKMASTIAIIVFGIAAILMSSVSYGLYADNKKLVVKNQLLSELYDVSVKNVDSLEKVIAEQNKQIDKFKNDSISFEFQVSQLNAEVEKMNGEKEEYAKMEEGREDSAEEAVQWLKEQAPSL